MSNRLFLLAHPDDEMLCLTSILDSYRSNLGTDYYLFLTLNGVSRSRILEAKNAMGVLSEYVRVSEMIGIDLVVRDGYGWQDLTLESLSLVIETISKLKFDVIVTFAYEGGHQDHDLLNVVAKILESRFDVPVIEFSGYRKMKFFPFFTVNNPVEKSKRIIYPRYKALKIFFILAKTHRSQFKVWCLLAPEIVSRLISGLIFEAKSSFPTSLSQKEKPLYELRKKVQRRQVESALLGILRSSEEGQQCD